MPLYKKKAHLIFLQRSRTIIKTYQDIYSGPNEFPLNMLKSLAEWK